jgi:hypothetical protein
VATAVARELLGSVRTSRTPRTLSCRDLHRLLTPAGEAAFPNAEVVVAADEAAFWLAEDALWRTVAEVKRSLRWAQKALKPYVARLRRVTPGGEVAAGITSVGPATHTQGIPSTASPRATTSCSSGVTRSTRQRCSSPTPTGRARSITTGSKRRRRGRHCSTWRQPIRSPTPGMHLAFPGVGQVACSATAYTFVPAPWQPAL